VPRQSFLLLLLRLNAKILNNLSTPPLAPRRLLGVEVDQVDLSIRNSAGGTRCRHPDLQRTHRHPARIRSGRSWVPHGRCWGRIRTLQGNPGESGRRWGGGIGSCCTPPGDRSSSPQKVGRSRIEPFPARSCIPVDRGRRRVPFPRWCWERRNPS